MAKKMNTKEPIKSITLSLLFKDDGGPLFHFLAEHKNPHMRGERIRQLMYLGLLREKELTRSTTVAVTPILPENAVPVRASELDASFEIGEEHRSEGRGDVRFHADDLAEFFGPAD